VTGTILTPKPELRHGNFLLHSGNFECPCREVRFAHVSAHRQPSRSGPKSAQERKARPSFDHLIGTSQAHASQIRNLQQLTVADPGSGKVGLGLAGCGAMTA
jgi:hypothetical protein